MSKLFYDHLVNREELTDFLDRYDLDPDEKAELVDLIDQTLHNHILKLIFDYLPVEHHPELVRHLHSSPHHPVVLEFIKTRITIDIETEIRGHAAQVKRDLMKEIRKSHRTK